MKGSKLSLAKPRAFTSKVARFRSGTGEPFKRVIMVLKHATECIAIALPGEPFSLVWRTIDM